MAVEFSMSTGRYSTGGQKLKTNKAVQLCFASDCILFGQRISVGAVQLCFASDCILFGRIRVGVAVVCKS
jgi:hypothetical protein